VPSPLNRLCGNSSSRPGPPTADASRDPDNVLAKLVPDFDQGAGNQTPNDVILGFLDSGSRPAKRRSSGMTGSCNHVILAQAGIQASFSNLYLWIPDLAQRVGARPE
jgi:hypothetical protein